MPVAIVAAMEFIGAAFAMEMTFTAVQLGMIANGAVLMGGLAYSTVQKRKAERAARAQYNAAQVDRLANVATTVAPRELVLGRCRKGGSVFFRGSTDANNTRFVMCIALAAHEIDAVETIYLNDVAVTLDGSGYVTTAPYALTRVESAQETFTGSSKVLANVPIAASVQVSRPAAYVGTDPGSQYNTVPVSHTLAGSTVTIGDTDGGTVSYQYNATTSKARIRSYLGTAGQTADATLISSFPALWTSAHRARGVAYLIAEFDYDETAFPSGLPTVTAVIRGAKIYDPRTGTTVWSENPALMARHILLHPQFGKRTSLSAAEDARITAAANACDVATTYTVGGVAQASRALYQAGIVIPFGTTARDAIDDVVQAMAGQWAYAAGEFFVRAGSYTASVLTLTDADLAVVQRGADGGVSQQPIAITTHRARDQQFNVVTPTIWDAAQDYKQSTLTPLKAAALITRDGAELVQDVSFPAISYAPQALHIAGVMLRDARDPLTVTLPFKLSAYRVELFDTISLTISRYGWSAKTFIVLGREWGGDGSIKLTLKENVASTYTMDASFSAQGGADNTALPSPWLVSPPTITSVTSGTADLTAASSGAVTTRATVTWGAVADYRVQAGTIELQWREPGDAVWKSVSVPGTATQVQIEGVPDARVIVLRARCITASAVSNWGTQVYHAAALPALLTDAVRQAALGDKIIEWVAAELGWPGTYSKCTPAFGVIEAHDTAWSAYTTWSNMTTWNDTPPTNSYYETAAMDIGDVITAVADVDATVQGRYTLEIATSQDNISWSSWATWTTASFVARYLKVRATIMPTTAYPVAKLLALRVAVHAQMTRETVEMQDISTYADRRGPGHVMLPTALRLVRRVAVAIHDDAADGWSWVLDKNAGPDWIIFTRGGVPADPYRVDFYIEGFGL
jgi:hypothetical protein